MRKVCEILVLIVVPLTYGLMSDFIYEFICRLRSAGCEKDNGGRR